MKIAVVGSGYVGLVSGACFAELGVEVTCVDVDSVKIENLRRGIIPIYEPNLETLINRNVQSGRLNFTTSIEECLGSVDIVFNAVGTPPLSDGSADLSYVMEVARTIGRAMNGYVLVVTKSTVPVGTAQRVKEVIAEELAARGLAIEFDVASNPEFLKEGNAIDDFMKPDRVVVGTDSDRARELITRLYKPIMLSNFRVMFMDIASAELTKYAANAMLATRISFMNDIANLCERVGADVAMVRRGIGSDSRIGNKFLYAGCGYGGSCFPKDVKALAQTARAHGYTMELVEAVDRVNERQKRVVFDKFIAQGGGSRAAVWGLSFKPGTDDIRQAPALVLIESLIEAGCAVRVYDPVAMGEARKVLGDRVEYATDIYDCVLDADVIFHMTEWKEFRFPNWEIVKRSVRTPLLIDGRNVYTKEDLEGITYINIGQ